MLHTPTTTANAEPFKRFVTSIARHQDEVREAQRLRWEVFAGEFGASLDSPQQGYDIDRFDAHCEHLIVRDRVRDRIIGTYRLLTAPGARAAGGYYSEQEFEMAAVLARRGRILEMGRSCVHPDHRGGAVVAMLWAGLAEFLAGDDHDTLIGCASISLADGGRQAAGVYASALRDHFAPPDHRVFPRNPWPLAAVDPSAQAAPPPLIKGYLRSGAVVCGAPAYDPDFQTADLFMMLPLERLETRHARHFRQTPPKVAA